MAVLYPAGAIELPAPPGQGPLVEDTLLHAKAFTEAHGVAGQLAAAAALAGYPLEAVQLAGTDDPVALLLDAADQAHALQTRALERMTPEKWKTLHEGSLAAQSLFEVGELRDGARQVTKNPAHLPAMEAGLTASDADHGLMWQAMYVLAVAVDEAVRLLKENPAGAPETDIVIETSLGRVGIASSVFCDTYYTGWWLIIIDECGNDTYDAPAGGADPVAGTPISIVVDTDGYDTVWGGWYYLPGQAGALNGGLALTYDAWGDEFRWGEGLVAGGGMDLGYGYLYDDGFGNDANHLGSFPAKLGGGFYDGVGILVDVEGYEYYSGDEFEMGSGWYGADAHGIHVDLGIGNDFYFDLSTFAEGSGGYGGTGFLLNEAGDDVYETFSPFEQGAGYVLGTGILVDLSGWDSYYTPWCEGQGWGDLDGTGLLLDLGAAWDWYSSPCPAVNSGIRPNGPGGLSADF